MMSNIPICPLMSAGNDIDRVCLEENCAWYMKNNKSCSVYILAYNAVLDIKKKQIGESR